MLLLVCAVAVGVFAADSTGAEETFRVYKADLTLGTDLRFNIKVQTGALPEGAGDIKLLVWEGAQDGVDYTQATTETAGYTELTAPIENEEGLLVFTYSGINAKEIGKTLYLRAYYKCNGETIYTEAKRYSMAQYLHSIYDSSDDKEKAVIDALMAYGDAAQELGNEGEPLPKISDGVVKITVSGGKFADGFTCGKFLAGEKLNVVADGTESAPMLTAELGEGCLWTMEDGKLSYEAEAEYYDGIYIGKYENAFEVTVGGNTEIHTDKTLAEVFALANGGTVKLLADVDMGEYNISLSLGEEITLDLNGKKITSSSIYIFNICNATLTVKDSVGGGNITTTAETVFFLNDASSVLTIEGGTFTSVSYVVHVFYGTTTIKGGTFTGEWYDVYVDGGTATIEGGEFTGATYYAVYVGGGTATITGGTFTGNIFAYTANGGTISITGGTFSSDPSAYAAGASENAQFGYVAVYDKINKNWLVRAATKDDYVAEVTVEGQETKKYFYVSEAFLNANGGTVKLLKDVDMGESNIQLGRGAETTIEITLDLNGKNITSDYLFDIYNAELTVKDSMSGGSITTTEETVFYLNVESSVLTIESGEFTGTRFAVYVGGGTATITGGEFTGNIFADTANGGTISITGGTFSSDPSAYAAIGYVAEATETGYIVRVATEADYVAEVTVGATTTKYTSLAAAFANANSGTVKLLKDVDMGESNISLGYKAETTIEITLDLNGKKITSSNAYLFDIYKATLTVKDDAVGGSVTTTGATVFRLKDASSVLTIESGEFTSATCAVYVDYGTAKIKGGTFTTYGEVVHVHEGKVEISGGTFTSESSKNTAVVVYISGGEVTISGGEFTGKNTVVEVGSGTVTISGGKFNGGRTVYVKGGEVTITGGTFTSENVEVVYVYGGEVTISGGTFSEAPSDYVAEGYKPAINPDGTFSVIREESSGNNEYIPV